ncbi:MAG TPA: hypothetical protein VLH41_05735, partial [Thermoanaerobaculia bacterium]|nr:hypothetical protein [Thermoanaerobaculia bacterium]
VTKTTAPLRLVAEGSAPAAIAGAPASTATSAPVAQADTTLPATPAAPAPAKEAAGAPTLDLSRRTVTVPLWVLIAVPAALVVGLASVLLARGPRSRRVDLQGAFAPEAGETKERAAARLDRALRDGLAKRYGLPEGVTAAAILATLEEKGVPEEARRETEALLADLDFLRFAPQLGDYEGKIRETRDRARRLFPRLF